MEKRSEGPVRITETTIEAARRRRKSEMRLTVRDMECRGLALVMNPTGMSWVVSYKPRGLDPSTGKRPATREVAVRSPATHSPEQAGAAAMEMKGDARKGAMEKAANERAATVDRLMDDDAAALPLRPRMQGTGPLSLAVMKEGMHHTVSHMRLRGFLGSIGFASGTGLRSCPFDLSGP